MGSLARGTNHRTEMASAWENDADRLRQGIGAPKAHRFLALGGAFHPGEDGSGPSSGGSKAPLGSTRAPDEQRRAPSETTLKRFDEPPRWAEECG